MKRTDIKTLEDAQKYIDQVEKERDDALKGKADAEKAANDAIAKADTAMAAALEAESQLPPTNVVKIKGLGTVRVNFGVDGISKEDLQKDTAKIKELIKKGSGAVEVVEPEGGK